MLFCFVILFCFQALGECFSHYLRLPIPGPVIGMVLLFFALLIWPRLLQKIESAAMDLLQHLSLLFIPAGVGIMVSYTQVGAAWFAVLASMLISTLLTMAVVALSFQYFQSNAQQPSDLHRGEAEEQQDHQDHQG